MQSCSSVVVGSHPRKRETLRPSSYCVVYVEGAVGCVSGVESWTVRSNRLLVH